MAFNGMTDRFEAKMDEIYGRYSARGPTGVGQPFLEIKPNDPNRRETANDTRLSPNGSFRRDQDRITAFLRSPLGVRFMLSQAELQTGNAFSETRLFNPLFLYGRLGVNAPRIQRSLTSASRGGGDKGANDIRGVIGGAASGFINGLLRGTPISDVQKSPGADTLVGDAGRLQKATAKAATDRLLGRSGPTGLINLLPPNRVVRVVSAVRGILESGIMGVNQRPELDIDGQYFSVVLWAKFSRVRPEPNSFVKAGASLRKGDIPGALRSLGAGVVNEIKTRLVGTKGAPIPSAARLGRDDASRTDLNGLRYFIVNDTEADRYLQNSVSAENKAVTEYLDRLPYRLNGVALNTAKPTPAKKRQEVRQNEAQKRSLLSKIGGFLKGAASALIGGSSVPGTNFRINATTGSQTKNPTTGNPAEERMLFAAMALANKYDTASGAVKFFKDGLQQQQIESFDKFKTLKSLGYVGGLNPGVPIVDDEGLFASKLRKVDDGRYFSDNGVTLKPILAIQPGGTTTGVDEDTKSLIRTAYRDTIDFMFHDYVNNRVIPFRAMLTSIQENINVDYDTQRYIGRTEKNIVYAGANRELSFTFFIQAFSKSELDFIWQKINYLTGLCFPASYTDGFMVPPFTQLTIGRYYTDQPGYIKSLSHTIEDNTSWDIDEDSQMPMGATVNVLFSVIEKTQVRTGSEFYGYGAPQLLDKPTSNSAQSLLSPVTFA